ncbi:MAG TPA: hypothetical protein VM328_01405, partial [Fimbriimonadaceae bacterium]|nr:hypothetical protein [Fimbriimonadaceae bacterium]
SRATLWTPDGQVIFIGSGTSTTMANDINDSGWVVGRRSDFATIWHVTTGLIDLHTLVVPSSGTGWQLVSAQSINAQGQIVGWGFLNGQRRGFLLTPTAVPAPGAIVVFVSAWIQMARRRRCKDRGRL